ncbi:MAG: hydrogenase small subunit [bacterium]
MKSFVFTRRQFMKMTMGATAALGISQLGWPKLLMADVSKKPAVVWLEGQDCTGCTESVLSCLTPDLRDVILDVVTIRYHETIMAGTGEVTEYALVKAIEEGGYVLVVEGSIPSADSRYLMVADSAFEATFIAAASNAAAIIAVGACACYGGIPRGTVSKGQGVEYFLNKYAISKPFINLPGCPIHPTWFYDTVLTYLGGEVPPLDANLRPVAHFGQNIHDNCPRRPHFERGEFLSDWNNPSTKDWCLFLKGCKGIQTNSDCPSLKWNDGVNWCIGCGSPCAGCTEPKFYDKFSPLYIATGVVFGPFGPIILPR